MTKNISKKGYMSEEDGLLRIKELINQRTFKPGTLIELVYGEDRCEKFKKRSQELMKYWIDRLEKEKGEDMGITISDESRKQLLRNIINEYNDIKNRKEKI